MITENVYSPIKDRSIKADLQNSVIWKTAYKKSDLSAKILKTHATMYVYTIKFDGPVPKQVTKVREMTSKEVAAIR